MEYLLDELYLRSEIHIATNIQRWLHFCEEEEYGGRDEQEDDQQRHNSKSGVSMRPWGAWRIAGNVVGSNWRVRCRHMRFVLYIREIEIDGRRAIIILIKRIQPWWAKGRRRRARKNVRAM